MKSLGFYFTYILITCTMVNWSLLVTKGFAFYLFTLIFLVVHLKITIVRNFVFRIINLNTDAVASSAVEMFLFV